MEFLLFEYDTNDAKQQQNNQYKSFLTGKLFTHTKCSLIVVCEGSACITRIDYFHAYCQVTKLIDFELSYINTNHDDFIGFAK